MLGQRYTKSFISSGCFVTSALYEYKKGYFKASKTYIVYVKLILAMSNHSLLLLTMVL